MNTHNTLYGCIFSQAKNTTTYSPAFIFRHKLAEIPLSTAPRFRLSGSSASVQVLHLQKNPPVKMVLIKLYPQVKSPAK
jgi:hypothetical protein